MLILLIIQALGNGRNAEKTNMLEETDHFHVSEWVIPLFIVIMIIVNYSFENIWHHFRKK